MGRVEIAGGLDMEVARKIVRPWMDQALGGLTVIVARHCPPARVWETRGDDRVRGTHQDAEGQAIPANLRFILKKPQRGPTASGQAEHAAHHAEGHGGGRTGNPAAKLESYGTEQGRYPRDEQLSPGNRYNCFPADTAACAPDLAAAWRAPYCGPMVTVRTRAGRIFSGTPNHPVLTNSGWVALGGLKVGDDLVCRPVGQAPADRRLSVAALVAAETPDVQGAPSTLGDIFYSLAVARDAQRMVRGAVDFYGDRPAGDVYVVRTDRELWFDSEPVRAEDIGDHSFAKTDPARFGDRPVSPFGVGDLAVAARDVGGARKPLAFVGTGPGHADIHSRRAVAQFGATALQPTAHPLPGDAVFDSQGLDRFARTISDYQLPDIGACVDRSIDSILHISVARNWSGYVYTLSTDSGIYDVADGVIVANCRCNAVTVVGMIAGTVHADLTEVAGPIVRGTVGSRFPRLAESEFGDGQEAGLHFMAAALEEFGGDIAAGR